MKLAVLVYQVGIANVFDVTGPTRRRLVQSDYSTCAAFARGMAAAGALVTTAHCDQAGDIASFDWAEGPGDLWADKKARVESHP
jgi:hypothetical protein